MTTERLQQLKAMPQMSVYQRMVCAEVLPEAVREIERLRAIVQQVDDVLIVNWVGPRADEDYKKALHDLMMFAVEEHRYFELEKLRIENAALRAVLNSAEVEE